MPVAANHSNNLPREFEQCPACGKKGLYRYGGSIVRMGERWGGTPPGRRCKYCRHRIEDLSSAEYEAQITATFGRKPVVESEPAFLLAKRPNGSIEALTISGKNPVVIERRLLLELTRMLAMDPTLCRLPERKFMAVV